MHTSKPFPYRPAVVARQDKPLPRPVAGAGDKPDVVAPHNYTAYARPFYAGEAVRPLPRDPQPALIQSKAVHEPAPAPGSPGAGFGPALTYRSYVPDLGLMVFTGVLACLAIVCLALYQARSAPSHVAVDDWCGKWPAGLSCKQQNAGK